MNKEEYKEILQKMLNHMTSNLENCEPELKCSYVATILDLTDRSYALERKIN